MGPRRLLKREEASWKVWGLFINFITVLCENGNGRRGAKGLGIWAGLKGRENSQHLRSTGSLPTNWPCENICYAYENS